MLAAGLLMLVLALVWLSDLMRTEAKTDLPMLAPDVVLELADRGVLMQRDEAFGVALPGRALRRVVQMLQWREVASIPLAPDDQVVNDQVDYQLIWSSRVIDSSVFSRPEGHENPPAPPYRSQSFGALPTAMDSVRSAAHWRVVPVDELELPENLAAAFRPEGVWLLSTAEGDVPQPGDLRLRYEVLPEHAPELAGIGTDPDVSLSGDDLLDESLNWIARAAAFIVATLGAALALLSASRRAAPGSRWHGVPPAGVLLLSLSVALVIALLATGIAALL